MPCWFIDTTLVYRLSTRRSVHSVLRMCGHLIYYPLRLSLLSCTQELFSPSSPSSRLFELPTYSSSVVSDFLQGFTKWIYGLEFWPGVETHRSVTTRWKKSAMLYLADVPLWWNKSLDVKILFKEKKKYTHISLIFYYYTILHYICMLHCITI